MAAEYTHPPTKPVIALNLLFLHSALAGVRRYAVELTRELVEGANSSPVRFAIVTTTKGLEALGTQIREVTEQTPDVDLHLLPGPPRTGARGMLLEWRDWKTLGSDFDGIHCFDYRPPWGASVPYSVTVHDLHYKENPSTFGWWSRRLRSFAFARARHMAAGVAVVSGFTQSALEQEWPERADMCVVPNGVKHTRSPVRVRMVSSTPTILAVGTMRRYKNFETLIDAIVELKKVRLVIVGRDGGHGATLERYVKRQGVSDRVVFAGGVSDDYLKKLYSAADAFMMASLYEGFGIPVLEAMAAGLPVACSEIPALVEVAGPAAIYFPPTDHNAAAIACRRVLNATVRRRLEARMNERLEQFGWGVAAEEWHKMWNKIIEGSQCRHVTQ